MEDILTHRKIHLVGIGGVGMCALAHLLKDSGREVSGSDRQDSEALANLRLANIEVFASHNSRHLEGVATVIYSPAIPHNNPELKAARELGLRVQSRAEALAEFISTRNPICITGSHGKTTTTAMLAFVLERAGLNPGYMIGGISSSLLRKNARVGGGPFVVEACEAFGALHNWCPSHCVITNIDDEHAEHYGGQERLKLAFRDMIGRVPPNGVIAVCGDDANLLTLRLETERRIISYGLKEGNIFRAQINSLDDRGTHFTVYKYDEELGSIELLVPGRHNVCNALAALVMADHFMIPFRQIALSLNEFQGVDRRYQFIGESCGIRIFDDYAHHPTEIDAVLNVARRAVNRKGRLVVVIEPQLHSRVMRLVESFSAALSVADFVLVMPVDAAGESFIEASDDALSTALDALGTKFVRLLSPMEVKAEALRYLKDHDVLVALGPRKASEAVKSYLPRIAGSGNYESCKK